MKDYTKFMSYALFTMIDRKTQDDNTSKIKVETLEASTNTTGFGSTQRLVYFSSLPPRFTISIAFVQLSQEHLSENA